MVCVLSIKKRLAITLVALAFLPLLIVWLMGLTLTAGALVSGGLALSVVGTIPLLLGGFGFYGVWVVLTELIGGKTRFSRTALFGCVVGLILDFGFLMATLRPTVEMGTAMIFGVPMFATIGLLLIAFVRQQRSSAVDSEPTG